MQAFLHRGRRGELRQLLRLAAPLWGAQVASVALPLTDALYMGRLNPVALAGGGLASTLLASAILIGGSALGGMVPRIARADASTDLVALAAYLRHARWLGAAIAAVVIMPAFATAPLLVAAGQPAAVADAAATYVLPAVLSVPFTLGCTVQRGLLAARRRARLVTLAWALAIPLNLALDHVLCQGAGPIPGLGLVGIGLATSVVSLSVWVFLLAAGIRAGVEPAEGWLGRYDGVIARDLLHLGGPIVLAVWAEAGVFALAGVAIGWFGSPSLAAHRVATLAAHLSFLAPLAIGQAAAIRVAATESVDQGAYAARVALASGVTWALASAVLVVLAARWIAGAFVPEAGEAFPISVTLLQVVAALQIPDSIQVIAAGVLRGAGDTVTAMRWALLAYLVIAPTAAFALAGAVGLGAVGVWLGLALALVVVAAALARRALRRPSSKPGITRR